MMKKVVWFSAGVLCTLLVLLSARVITGRAADGWKNIDVYYGDMKIFVDDETLEVRDEKGNLVKPFIYEGTTYVPLRAVAQACGKPVVWNEQINAVFVGASNYYCVTDLDQDGEYELIYKMLFGSGEVREFLCCYNQKYDITSLFGVSPTEVGGDYRFTIEKQDDAHASLVFASGEEAQLQIVERDGRRYLDVILPDTMPPEVQEDIDRIAGYRLERGI